ncbi:MAG: antibiotic biosynthesis monooxygenase [Rhodoferax sp.]
MVIVIFRAKIRRMDESYTKFSSMLRELAVKKYGCQALYATTEGNEEIAISHWPNLASVDAWRADLDHQWAQNQARERWYESYSVQLAEVVAQHQWVRA